MKRLICVVALIFLSLGSWIEAGKNDKGGGDKPSSSETYAEFFFPADSSGSVITGDNSPAATVYHDVDQTNLIEDDGVNARFMGSGNPELVIDEFSNRFLAIKVDPLEGGCPLSDTIAARGDRLWFADLNTAPDGLGSGITDNFLGMAPEDGPYYSIMPVRFLQDEGGVLYRYTVLFGAQPENSDGIRERVVVTRTIDGTWQIEGLVSQTSVALIQKTNLSQKVKGRYVTTDLGYCTFKIDFDISLQP